MTQASFWQMVGLIPAAPAAEAAAEAAPAVQPVETWTGCCGGVVANGWLISRMQYLSRMYQFAFFDNFSGQEWNDGLVVDVLHVDPVRGVSGYQPPALEPQSSAVAYFF